MFGISAIRKGKVPSITTRLMPKFTGKDKK
jgi:hypothetical protein